MASKTGWCHSGLRRTGHYLDWGEPICGYDAQGLPGAVDVRSDAPADTCAKCERLVARHNGAPPHEHVWQDVRGLGPDSKRVCIRCAETAAW
jgi:hypothetical protein